MCVCGFIHLEWVLFFCPSSTYICWCAISGLSVSHLQDDVLLLFLCEGRPGGVDTGVHVSAGHEKLRSLKEVKLLRVVLEDHAVGTASRPVGQTLQYQLMVL